MVAQNIAFVNLFPHISTENIPNSYIGSQMKKLSPAGKTAAVIKGVCIERKLSPTLLVNRINHLLQFVHGDSPIDETLRWTIGPEHHRSPCVGGQ